MAKIGYLRVSSAVQNLDRQEDALQSLSLDRVFSDKMSGKAADRPRLAFNSRNPRPEEGWLCLSQGTD